jgi:hypothetical protein
MAKMMSVVINKKDNAVIHNTRALLFNAVVVVEMVALVFECIFIF